MRETVVVANAPWRWRPDFVALVRRAWMVLAADGGANHLARIGVRPEAVIGDLDSIRPGVRRWIGEERMVARADQNSTDLQKTLAYAFDERGAERVTVLAATAGRLDHALENLAVLGRWIGHGEVELRDDRHRIVAVAGTRSLATTTGQTVSLMPLGKCARVWTAGLRWSLDGEPLDLAGRTGISNVADGELIELRVEGGTILVFLSETVPEG
ncbi:MAG: thiamine diphosphokinase [Acidobacteriia bacterium]|nr:thiamine diphosphokinase [Terriglobia bacterium]